MILALLVDFLSKFLLFKNDRKSIQFGIVPQMITNKSSSFHNFKEDHTPRQEDAADGLLELLAESTQRSFCGEEVELQFTHCTEQDNHLIKIPLLLTKSEIEGLEALASPE